MLSKLGFQTLNAKADIVRLAKAGAPFILLVDSFGVAGEILAANPDVLLVGRSYTPWDVLGAYDQGWTAQKALDHWLFSGETRQWQQIAANPLVKIWTGPNEPVFGPASDPAAVKKMAWYAEFEALRAEWMAKQGLRVVVGNFSTGSPDLDLWKTFLPAVEAAKKYKGYLGGHSYSWPTMDWMTESEDGRLYGWTTLRYRRVYRDYLIPAGLGDVPYLDTELGIDPGSRPYPKGFQNRGDGGAFNSDTLRKVWREGYSQAAPEPAYSFAANDDPQRFYADQFIWHDRETQKDSFYAGGAVFVVGSFGGSWGNFDLEGQKVVDHLCAHLTNSRISPPAPVTGTHQVKEGVIALNVRLHPWLTTVVPPIVDLLGKSQVVTVLAEAKMPNGTTWALIKPGGNGWVNTSYLQPVVKLSTPLAQAMFDAAAREVVTFKVESAPGSEIPARESEPGAGNLAGQAKRVKK